MKRIYINIILACSFVACALTACTDAWDEHYQTDPILSGDENLWELISSKPELEQFAALLQATGYDSLLTMNRSYTVWAPTQMPGDFDVTLLNNDSALKVYRKEIVENHIADFSHVAGGLRDKEDKKTYSKIEMLNGKAYDFTGPANGGYLFADNRLNSSNEVAKNGVLHVLDGYVSFAANIWEQLARESKLIGKLFAFLEKDYKREFNPYGSTPGPIVDGQPTYLDSAFTESCRWFYEIGQLNREDSSYTMYALTDKAWDDLIDETKKYFVYDPKMKVLPEFGSISPEQLSDSIVREFACKNLVFSNTVNKRYYQGEKDSLISTTMQLFPGDTARALADGCLKTVNLSNGTLHIIDKVNYKPYTWGFDTIRFEGESLVGNWTEQETVVKNANAKWAGIDKDSIVNDIVVYDHVSKGAVGVITPKEEKDKPTLNFYIDNILSGYYKVSIVLLPPHIVNSADSSFIKPNKFNARLYYADGTNSGSLGVKKDTNPDPSYVEGTTQAFISDETKIDTIVLAECIKIPYCEYRVKNLSGKSRLTRLELTTEITFGAYNAAAARFDNRGDKNQGRWKYDNSYRIDQVIFEPIEDPEGE